MAKSPLYVDLVIQGAGHTLAFEMQDGFQTGYENQLEEKAGKMLTHPMVYMWKGGKVKPFTVELDLAVGVQRFITSPEKLIGVIEALYDMALAARSSLESVIVSVQGSSRTWFRCRAFLQSIGATQMPPYDMTTGIPLHAKVSLSFTPTYSAFAGGKSRTSVRSLPRRPWRFVSQVGGR